MYRIMIAASVVLAVASMAVLGGCGSTACAPSPVDTSTTLQGVVYTSGYVPAQAGQAPGAQVVFYGSVTVRRTSNGSYIADTQTSSTGRYMMRNLPRGPEVTITCASPSGEQLMTTATLNGPDVTADIDEDTTLVTQCLMLMRNNGGGVTSDAIEAAVQQLCMQWQQAHRYEYGECNGNRPDFTDRAAIRAAAMALLAAAADNAVQQAGADGSLDACLQAVDMVCGKLRAEGQMQGNLDTLARQAAAAALRNGNSFTIADVAQVVTKALNG